uniref:Uncharacterized protein n=1 Tax=Panagrolaimus sp. ES5 TaxID=591445 RepID=A0AC34FT31_9BILA
MSQLPLYVIATNLVDTCIYDLHSSQKANLPSKSKAELFNQFGYKFCNSRNFFKSIRELYYPSQVASVVLPYIEIDNPESKVSLIRNGSAFGYKNVTLVSFESAALIRALSTVKIDPERNDVCIFIFHLHENICTTIIQFDGETWIPKKRYMTSVKIYNDELKMFCNNLILNAPLSKKNYSLIIGYSKELQEGRKNFFKNIFGSYPIHFFDISKPDEYGMKGIFGGILTKARILGGTESLKKYDVANVSDYKYKAVADGKDVFMFKVQYQKVPFKKEHDLEVEIGSKIELYKCHFISDEWVDDPAFSFLTKASKIKLVLEIDSNGIVDFQVTEFPNDKPPSPSVAVKTRRTNNIPSKKPSLSSLASFDQQQTSSKHMHSSLLCDVSITFPNIDSERIATAAAAETRKFDKLSLNVSQMSTEEEHVEFLILENSITVYHVSEFGRYPIVNSFGNEKTPAYIGFHSLPPAIGEEAQNQLENHPNSTVYDFIPIFGKEFSKIRINPKWKFCVIPSKDAVPVAEIQMETLRGKRRSSISTLMSIMFIHILQIAAEYVDFPITEVKVSFAPELNFCNTELLKVALKNAKIDLIEQK